MTIKNGFALLCVAAMVPAVASAIVPDPVLSVTPDCISVDPGGGIDITVEVIGNNTLPLPHEEVRVIFNGGCSDDTTVPITGLAEDVGSSCASPTVLSGTTNAAALIVFNPLIGGCCELTSACTIEADPGAVTLLPVYDVVSTTDWSFCVTTGLNFASGDVNLADFTAFQQEFLGSPANLCHDFPTGVPPMCNQNVDLADFTFFQQRFLNGDGDCPACPPPP